MLLDKNWKIEADSMNVTVSRRCINKKNKEAWRPEGFFSTVPDAIKFLIRLRVNETGLKDLKTVQAEISRLEKILEHLPEMLTATTGGIKG